jgi:ribosomal protein S18 acetylase RimI-like enzyme
MLTSGIACLPWRTTSQLSQTDRAFIFEFLADKPWYDFYFRSGLSALARSQDNRFYRIGRAQRGLLMGIVFDRLVVCSLVGELAEDEVMSVLTLGERLEIHATGPQATLLAAHGAGIMRSRIAYYRLLHPPGRAVDPRCQALTTAQLDLAQEFYATHYPQAVFSAWMLEQPFIGVFEQEQLVAAAGTIAIEPQLRACHVGNFLTRPGRRGCGLAAAVGGALIERLRARGIDDYRLGVNADNTSARRLYESLGFEQLDSRELLLSAAAGS